MINLSRFIRTNPFQKRPRELYTINIFISLLSVVGSSQLSWSPSLKIFRWWCWPYVCMPFNWVVFSFWKHATIINVTPPEITSLPPNFVPRDRAGVSICHLLFKFKLLLCFRVSMDAAHCITMLSLSCYITGMVLLPLPNGYSCPLSANLNTILAFFETFKRPAIR